MSRMRWVSIVTGGLLFACTACWGQRAPEVTVTGSPSFPEKNLLKNPDFRLHDGDKIARGVPKLITVQTRDRGPSRRLGSGREGSSMAY